MMPAALGLPALVVEACEAALRLARGPDDPEAQRVRQESIAAWRAGRRRHIDRARVLQAGRRYARQLAIAADESRSARVRQKALGRARAELLEILRGGVTGEELAAADRLLERDLALEEDDAHPGASAPASEE